jgi:hypothetical protein
VPADLPRAQANPAHHRHGSPSAARVEQQIDQAGEDLRMKLCIGNGLRRASDQDAKWPDFADRAWGTSIDNYFGHNPCWKP